MNVKECQLCIHKTRTSRTSSINLFFKKSDAKTCFIRDIDFTLDHRSPDQKIIDKGRFHNCHNCISFGRTY